MNSIESERLPVRRGPMVKLTLASNLVISLL